jgi:hypothetical protein
VCCVCYLNNHTSAAISVVLGIIVVVIAIHIIATIFIIIIAYIPIVIIIVIIIAIIIITSIWRTRENCFYFIIIIYRLKTLCGSWI